MLFLSLLLTYFGYLLTNSIKLDNKTEIASETQYNYNQIQYTDLRGVVKSLCGLNHQKCRT